MYVFMNSSRDYFIEIRVQVVPQPHFRNKCMRHPFTIKQKVGKTSVSL